MPGKIFVNYRRDDERAFAARIRDRLAQAFGNSNVFMDVDNLMAGQRFDLELEKALAETDVFLAVIGPRWMELYQQRQASGERDYVHQEIAGALKRGLTIIPVLIEGAQLPRAEALPEDIRELLLHQKHGVGHEQFGRDVSGLIEAIKFARRSATPPPPNVPWGWIGASASATLAVAYVGAYQMGVPVPWPWPPNRPALQPTQQQLAKAARERVATEEAARQAAARKAAEEAQAKRLAEQRAEADRQRVAAEAKRKGDEARAKATAETEAKRKAEEAGRRRLAAQKADEEHKRIEAETKRKADDARAKTASVQPPPADRPLLAGLHESIFNPIPALAPGSGKSARDRLAKGGECRFCPEMVVVPAGNFTMGSPKNEPERGKDETQLKVSIPRPFAVGKFAVTFDEWDACVADGGCNGYKPSDHGWGRGKQPVINVSWDDAKAYSVWLSQKTGHRYRLLSETEREFVARAGSKTPFWWGAGITPLQANYMGNITYQRGGAKGEFRQRTVAVDSFKANPWGLFQVHGNVYEWTEDCWNESNRGNPGDGTARTDGDCNSRVVRGGSWANGPGSLRAGLRSSSPTEERNAALSFRVARPIGN